MSQQTEGGSSTEGASPEVIPPWYRQFWPWFIIALPASIVVASIGMVIVAFKNADTLVVDNYYREGLAINQVLEQDDKARELGISADIRLDRETGELLITVNSQSSIGNQLTLSLLHPTDQKRDQKLPLLALSDKYFRADIETRLNSRYYLRLMPADEQWRLNGELDFSTSEQVTLSPQ